MSKIINFNKNMIYIDDDEIGYFQFKKLLEYPELIHCYVGRKNKIDFKKIGDNSNLIRSNEIICEKLGININNIIRPKQTHTDIIKNVKESFNNNNELIGDKKYANVDGLLTNKYNIPLELTYADCIPIYLYDPVKNVIGNIHSGWRGTLQKIGEKAIKKMINDYNSNPKDIIACIGPSICKKHFEVEEDVYKLFKKEFEYTGRINEIIEIGLKKENIQKYYIDTVLINRILFENMGLNSKNIIESNVCTVCNSNLIHSYRTDKVLSGRNAAIICLKK